MVVFCRDNRTDQWRLAFWKSNAVVTFTARCDARDNKVICSKARHSKRIENPALCTRNGAEKPISEQMTESFCFKFFIVKPNHSKQSGEVCRMSSQEHTRTINSKESKQKEKGTL